MTPTVPVQLALPGESRLWKQDFILGAATAAFQIEGDASHRQKNIWDAFCEQPGHIADGSDGRVACDHVARLDEDLDLLAQLNVDAYRFSLSWGRILDADGTINPRGLDFYQRLLDGLCHRGIKPWTTLYHWDLPLVLEQRGGWTNRDTAYRFRDYVETVSGVLSDRVAAWITINEPMICGYFGYATGVHAPGRTCPEDYPGVAHHLLLAHGLGMQVLEAQAPSTPRGIALNVSPVDPATEDTQDKQAAERSFLTFYRRFLDPLLTGQYPNDLGSLPGERAPDIHDEDLALISAPMDFMGINYYTRSVVRAAPNAPFEEVAPEGELTDMGWEVCPEALTRLLVQLNRSYDLPPVYITENGAAYPDKPDQGEVVDERRLAYIQGHLLAVDEAVRHGVDVRGLFYWSLLDNFEWAEGYLKRFGIVYVDYTTQQRIIKASGKAYGDLLMQRKTRQNERRMGAGGD